MPSHMTLTKPQGQALHKFLAPKLESVDALIEEIGQEDAFRVYAVFQRLPESEPEPDDTGSK